MPFLLSTLAGFLTNLVISTLLGEWAFYGLFFGFAACLFGLSFQPRRSTFWQGGLFGFCLGIELLGTARPGAAMLVGLICLASIGLVHRYMSVLVPLNRFFISLCALVLAYVCFLYPLDSGSVHRLLLLIFPSILVMALTASNRAVVSLEHS